MFCILRCGCVTCDAWGGWLVPLFVCGVCVRARGCARCDAMRAWTPLLHLGLVPPTHTADSVWSCCRSSRVVSSASSTPSVVTRSLRECARALPPSTHHDCLVPPLSAPAMALLGRDGMATPCVAASCAFISSSRFVSWLRVGDHTHCEDEVKEGVCVRAR
jgi:hypothetical protein